MRVDIEQVSNGFIVYASDALTKVFETGNEVEMFKFVQEHFNLSVISFDEEAAEPQGEDEPDELTEQMQEAGKAAAQERNIDISEQI